MIKDCHVGVKGLICVRDAYLVLQSQNGYWDIPGGRIDGDETIVETLQRELKEELPEIGAHTIEGVVYAYRLSKNIIDDKGLVLLFHKVIAEPFEIVLSNEHKDYRWVTKDTIHELLESGVPIEPGYYEALKKVLT